MVFCYVVVLVSMNVNVVISNVKFVFMIDVDIDVYCDWFVCDGVIVCDLKCYDGFLYWMVDGIDLEGNVF